MYYVNAQTCANTANIYSFNYNGHTYEVVKEKKNWTDAAGVWQQTKNSARLLDQKEKEQDVLDVCT